MNESKSKWLPLPLELEAITPEWLSAALSEHYPGTRVKFVSSDNINRGTSTSGRLNVEYAGASALPRTLYVKGGFDAAMRRRVWVALAVESRFYSEIAPTLAARIPKAYFAGADDATRQGIVVLEDLAARGATFGHATRPIDAQAMARLLDLLADMHAQWWESPDLEKIADGATPQRTFVKYLLRPKHWSDVLARPYGHLIEGPLSDQNFVARGLDHMWALNDRRSQTLIHGDTHPGNLYFESDGSPGLMDWQCVQKGHWAHDVMWLIVCGMGIEERRRNEQALVEYYLRRLSDAGVTAPEFEEAWLSYRQNMIYGVACSVANPYDMQSEAVTRISAERVLAAVADLDVVNSLGLA